MYDLSVLFSPFLPDRSKPAKLGYLAGLITFKLLLQNIPQRNASVHKSSVVMV